MTLLLESPSLVVALGALLITAAGVFFAQSRSLGALIAVVVAVLLTVGGLAVERYVVTPGEAVRGVIGRLFDGIAANSLPGVLKTIDPGAAEMQADANTLMPMFDVLQAGEGGGVDVVVDPSGDTATATLKPLIKVTHKGSGATGVYFNGLELRFVRRGELWLISGYTAEEDWRAGARKLSR
ncbi:MAG: hypothetical protein AAFV43_06270 [Planctomycetota bacterium]